MQSYDYHVWANQKVFECLYELPREIVYQEMQSVFPTVFSVMAHIYLMDITWFYAMGGDSFEQVRAKVGPMYAEVNSKTLEELQQMYHEITEKYNNFFAVQEDLDRIFSIHHPQLGSMNTTLSELAQHVSNHGTSHRGNLSAMLRQQGRKGVSTDYIFYLFAKQSPK